MFRWIKFNAVGMSGFAVQTGVLIVLTHGPVNYLAATGCAVELAILNNFVWHQRWTWKDRPTLSRNETMRRLARFHLTNGVTSITGNLLLMALLVGVVHLPIIASNVLSVVACSLINFILADKIAFHVGGTMRPEID